MVMYLYRKIWYLYNQHSVLGYLFRYKKSSGVAILIVFQVSNKQTTVLGTWCRKLLPWCLCFFILC